MEVNERRCWSMSLGLSDKVEDEGKKDTDCCRGPVYS